MAFIRDDLDEMQAKVDASCEEINSGARTADAEADEISGELGNFVKDAESLIEQVEAERKKIQEKEDE